MSATLFAGPIEPDVIRFDGQTLFEVAGPRVDSDDPQHYVTEQALLLELAPWKRTGLHFIDK